MLSKNLHISEQELLLAADGELSSRRAAQVHAHLAACWDCRARMADIEGTIVDFARAHRQTFNSQLPPIAGPRALLRARLAELASKPAPQSRQWFFQLISPRNVAVLCLLSIAAAIAGVFFYEHSNQQGANTIIVRSEHGVVPDPRLTPGAMRETTISDLCSMPHEEVVGPVTEPLRQEVFKEYGITNPRASEYEVDYLIAPGLGGAEDIHNLWPQSSTSRTWNAYVKDDLEERLHQLVCAHEVSLSAAQHEIATDWIAAYKKYFHTDKPLPLHSALCPIGVLGIPGSSPQTEWFDGRS